MTYNRRKFLRTGMVAIAGASLGKNLLAQGNAAPAKTAAKATPPQGFRSKAVDELVATVKAKINDPKLASMFAKCYPNTLDTTVSHSLRNGVPDTFVITGDIHAMWLRDSSAQVWPYLPLLRRDAALQAVVGGLVRRQASCVCLDSYANAFNDGPTGSEWAKDLTDMKPELHERKWEIDSLCYTIRLAYGYWKATGDTSPFDTTWQQAAQLIYRTFVEQQRKTGHGPYHFMRLTERASDTQWNDGYGNPVRPVGLIFSAFRPSDDATMFGFLIPSNLFAVTSLRQLAELHAAVVGNAEFAKKCTALADEVEAAVQRYGIVQHPTYGRIYAFEVDGYGNHLCMDDANVPSLLSLPYLGCCTTDDEVYRNTRRFVLSTDNPYFFVGKAAEGIGGPHIGYDYIWPMSITMRALTSRDEGEMRRCLHMLRDTDGGTGFMHESFHKDNPSKFTRKWFAWANTLFGELVLKRFEDLKI